MQHYPFLQAKNSINSHIFLSACRTVFITPKNFSSRIFKMAQLNSIIATLFVVLTVLHVSIGHFIISKRADRMAKESLLRKLKTYFDDDLIKDAVKKSEEDGKQSTVESAIREELRRRNLRWAGKSPVRPSDNDFGLSDKSSIVKTLQKLEKRLAELEDSNTNKLEGE